MPGAGPAFGVLCRHACRLCEHPHALLLQTLHEDLAHIPYPCATARALTTQWYTCSTASTSSTWQPQTHRQNMHLPRSGSILQPPNNHPQDQDKAISSGMLAHGQINQQPMVRLRHPSPACRRVREAGSLVARQALGAVLAHDQHRPGRASMRPAPQTLPGSGAGLQGC